MKKQDNKSLIQEVTKRLDWYTMEASDEEFDADEVLPPKNPYGLAYL